MTLTKQSRRCWCLSSNLRSKQGELEPLWTSVKRSSLRPVLNDTKISVGCCAVNSSPGKYTFKQERKPSKTAMLRVQRVCCLLCWAWVHSPSKTWFCCINNHHSAKPRHLLASHAHYSIFNLFTRPRVNTEIHLRLRWQRINTDSHPVLTHSITGSIAASLSVRICSSPLVTSFKAGPELLASTTCKQMRFGKNIRSSRTL